MADHSLADLAGSGAAGARRQRPATDDSGRIVWRQGAFDDRTWRRMAACGDMDPNVFFPVGTTGVAVQQIAEAKAICHRCPVRLACLQYALVSHQEDGVWGGHSEEERREFRRAWRRLGRPVQIVPRSPQQAGGPAVHGDAHDLPPEAS